MNSEELRQWYLRELAEKDDLISSKSQECDELKEQVNVFKEYVEVDVEMYQLRLKERDDARKRCEDLEAAMNGLLRTNQAWPLIDIIKKLSDGTDKLLHEKDYDALGWEDYEHAFRLSKVWIENHDSFLKLLNQIKS